LKESKPPLESGGFFYLLYFENGSLQIHGPSILFSGTSY
jgi:hypothetical protein